MSEEDIKPANTKQEAKAVDADSAPDTDFSQAVRKIAEKKPEIMEFMAMAMGPMGNPLHHKMTSEHISKVLELSEKHDERQYELQNKHQNNEASEKSSNRKYFFSAFCIIVVLIALVLFLFREKPEVLIPILTGLGGVITGGLGGWGLGSKKN